MHFVDTRVRVLKANILGLMERMFCFHNQLNVILLLPILQVRYTHTKGFDLKMID